MKTKHLNYLLILFLATFIIACSPQNGNQTPNKVNDVNRPEPTAPNEQPMPETPPGAPETPQPKPNTNVGKDCLDLSKVKSDEVCPRLYKPVCGCDNVTYTNDCLARQAGILKWTEGACK